MWRKTWLTQAEAEGLAELMGSFAIEYVLLPVLFENTVLEGCCAIVFGAKSVELT